MVAVRGNNWWLAPSLVELFAEADRLAPNRSTLSDGSIGDPSHSARASDHNPAANGAVCAADLTHDPRGGMDAHAFAEHLRVARDGRVKYVISRGRIVSATRSPWVWRTYTGANPHDKHVHVSIPNTASARDDTSSWFDSIPTPPEDDDMNELQNAMLAEALERIQRIDKAFDMPHQPDKWSGNLPGRVDALFAERDIDRLADALAGKLRGVGSTVTVETVAEALRRIRDED